MPIYIHLCFFQLLPQCFVKGTTTLLRYYSVFKVTNIHGVTNFWKAVKVFKACIMILDHLII